MSRSTAAPSPTLPGTDPAVQALAIHEAAHAVATLRGRGRVSKVELVVRGGDVVRGWTTGKYPDGSEGHWASIVTSLAAIPAETRFVSTIADKRVGEARRRLLAEDPTGDVADAHKELEVLRAEFRDRRTFRDAERAAASLVDRNWDRIEHIARELLTAPGYVLHNVRL